MYPSSRRPHVVSTIFFRLLGAVVVVAGTAVAALAIRQIVAVGGPQSLTPGGSRTVAAGISVLFWGLVILVSGCYTWRAGRRVGWKDRVGRVFLIVGYVVIAVAVSRTVQVVMELWQSGPHDEATTFAPLVGFLLIGGPGAVIAEIGRRMADESFLLTTSFDVRYH